MLQLFFFQRSKLPFWEIPFQARREIHRSLFPYRLFCRSFEPIKETPVLTGKDAERFAQAVANPKKVVREDVLRAQAVYKRLYACSELR